MHIQEFQAKKMLAGHGIRVPEGEVAAGVQVVDSPVSLGESVMQALNS